MLTSKGGAQAAAQLHPAQLLLKGGLGCSVRRTARRTLAFRGSPRTQQPRTRVSAAPDDQQSVLDDERLIRACIGIGLNGSLAVGGAKLGGIDLFQNFNFGEEGYQAAAIIGAGVLLGYDTLWLGLPWYQQLMTPNNEASGSESQEKKGRPFNMQLSPTLMSSPSSREQVSWETVSATLALQQACVAATFTLLKPNTPITLDIGFAVLREFSKELIQRGLFAAFVVGWLADRAFEAGIDDDILFYGQVFYLPDVVRYSTAFLLTTLAIPAVITDAEGLSLSVATNWTFLSSDSTKSGEEGEEEKDELLKEYALLQSLQQGINSLPARLTLALTAVRNTLRYGVINFSWAYTNNLAASFTVAVASSLALLVYADKARKDLQLTGPRPKSSE